MTAVYAYPVAVDCGYSREQLRDSGELVLGFGHSALAVDGLLELRSPVSRAPVVLNVDEVALLGHQHLPHPYVAQPLVADHLGLRTAVDIDYQRIFLRRVVVPRVEQAVVVVELPVGRAHPAEFHAALGVFVQGVDGVEYPVDDLSVGVLDHGDSRDVDAAVSVYEFGAVGRHVDFVPAALPGQALRFADAPALFKNRCSEIS